jgi:hypothetical protein
MPVRRRPDVDAIARGLGHVGRIAAGLPATLRGGGAIPYVLGDRCVGAILPGVGLRLDVDRRALGIDRPIAHVIDRSPMARLRDAFDRFVADTRGAIVTSMASLRSQGATFQQVLEFQKASDTAVVGAWKDVYLQAGNPGAGSYAAFGGGGASKNNTDAGSLIFGARNPLSASDTMYLAVFAFAAIGNAPIGYGTFLVVDMLVGMGGFDTNSAALQTTNSVPLTRYTTGQGVWAAAIGDSPATNVGGTANTATVSYTNSASVAGRTGTGNYPGGGQFVNYLLWGSLNPGDQLALPLQAGDVGVQSVQTLQFSIGAGTAGATVALLLYRPLTMVTGAGLSNFVAEHDVVVQPEKLTPLAVDSNGKLGCLGLFMIPSPGAGALQAGFGLLEGGPSAVP